MFNLNFKQMIWQQHKSSLGQCLSCNTNYKRKLRQTKLNKQWWYNNCKVNLSRFDEKVTTTEDTGSDDTNDISSTDDEDNWDDWDDQVVKEWQI